MPEDVKGFNWSYAGCHLAAHFPVVLHKPPLLFSSIKIKLSSHIKLLKLFISTTLLKSNLGNYEYIRNMYMHMYRCEP